MKSDTCRQLFWKLGVIDKLLTGKDGNVRAAIVRVPESQRNNKLLRRSVKHLFPIEVRQEASLNDALTGSRDSSPLIGQTNSSTLDSTPQVTRPRQQAAIVGEQRRRNS